MEKPRRSAGLETGRTVDSKAGPWLRARLRPRLETGRACDRRARGRDRRARLRRVGVGRALADLLAAQQRLHFIAGERLVFEQRLGDDVETVDVFREDLSGLALAFLDDATDFLVDQLGGLVGDVLALGH